MYVLKLNSTNLNICKIGCPNRAFKVIEEFEDRIYSGMEFHSLGGHTRNALSP